MSLLIPSHALPPFSYLVPEYLTGKVRVGTAVVAPLSGYSRLGIVVGFEEIGERALKEIRGVVEELSLTEDLVRLCCWAAGAAALPLHATLRMALPPGVKIDTYEIRQPEADWPWKVGTVVGRAQLRRTLGSENLKAAERDGRLIFAPLTPTQRSVEWATSEEGAIDLRRAPRQRALLKALAGYERGRAVGDLLQAAGAGRDTLRRLVRRGAVRLERRPEPAPILYTKGSGASLATYEGVANRALLGGGAWLWRMPSVDSTVAAATLARAAARRGEQTLVLAPEIATVDRLVAEFENLLPAGLMIAPYHSALGRSRAAVYEAVRQGEVDVLVGTRAAMLVPAARLGVVCVVDEPNEAHRATPGYDGVPIHARELARERGRIEAAVTVFLSPFPSLRLYAPESGVGHLPPREPTAWPGIVVVDMRGTGALLSSTLLEACRRTIQVGGRVGVVVSRLGDARGVYCNRCGCVLSCPACDLPLRLHKKLSSGTFGGGSLFCASCGHREDAVEECPACGSGRVGPAGLATARVQSELASALNVQIGLHTAGAKEAEEAPIVVGTAGCMFEEERDLFVVPDADFLLFGGVGSVEKGFRLLYRVAEVSRNQLLVQTRLPEHYALLAALRGDYEAFAAAELPKRRALEYPPHAHLAEVVFEGSEEAMRRAVESRLRPALNDRVKMLDPAPFPGADGRPVWRVLLRSHRRTALAETTALVARLGAESRNRDGLRARINMDPEEV